MSLKRGDMSLGKECLIDARQVEKQASRLVNLGLRQILNERIAFPLSQAFNASIEDY